MLVSTIFLLGVCVADLHILLVAIGHPDALPTPYSPLVFTQPGPTTALCQVIGQLDDTAWSRAA